MSGDSEKLAAAWDTLLLTLGGPASDDKPKTQELPEKRIPVTVLSGFLGAGKTTLLCQMLESASIEILAIVNDVASINVDAQKIRARNAETVEFSNGCTCCVLSSDLQDTLAEIGARTKVPDAIVIEASGLSDPLGIAQTVANVETMVLDGVVTVVDALTFRQRVADPVTTKLFNRQVAAAHLLALTKSATDCAGLIEDVGRLAPGRPVLVANGLADAEGIGFEVLLGAATRGARPALAAEQHAYAGFAVETLEYASPISAQRFFALMDDLPTSLFRIKGWIWLQTSVGEAAVCFEVQVAGSRWRVVPQPGSDRRSALVVIGRAEDHAFEGFVRRLRQLELRSEVEVAAP